MAENKVNGRSRKKKVTLASRFYAEMMKAKRWISAAVCVSMLGSSVVNPAMLAYADSSSDDEEIQEFELESEAIGQAITEAIADGSLVTAEDLGFSGAEEDTYAELFDADGLLYEVKPEIEETKDEDGDLDLRIFVRLDVVDLLDEGETLDGYEITGDEDVFFMLVNDTDSEQNAIVIVDGRETDVITVAPESEVAEVAAEDAEIVIPAAGGSGAGGAAASDEEAEVVILDEEATEEAEPSDDTDDAEPADDATDDVASADDDTEDAEPADDVESKDETEDADPAEEADNADDADPADDSDDAEQDDAADEKQDDTGAEDSGDDASDNESDTDSESGDSSDSSDGSDSSDSSDSSNDSSDSGDSGESSDSGNDSDSSDSSDDSSDSSEVASISVHKYNLVTLAASPADAKEAEEELIVSEDSNQLDGELYDAVAMEDGAAVVFVTTTEELGLEGVLSSGNDSVYTAETETAVITAVVPDGAFDEEVYLYAEEITESSETWQQVEEIWEEKAAEEGVSGVDSAFVTYDICFKNAADEEVEPEEGSNIAIRIRFIDGSVLTGYDVTADNLSLLHISDDGEVEEIEAMTTVGEADSVETIEYEASSFSLYTARIMALAAANGVVAQIGETTYETLQSAIDAAQSGDTVTLLVDRTENVSITSGQDLTLDLGGYILTGTGTTGKPVIDNYGGTLKLKNGTVTGGYGMYGQRNTNRTWYAGGNIYNSGTLEVSNVTIRSNLSEANVRGGGIYTEGTLSLSNVTIENCWSGTGANCGSAIYASNCDVTIKDSTIQDNSANVVSYGTIYYTSVDGNITLEDSDLLSNSGGGLYINQAGSVSVRNCEITGNSKKNETSNIKGTAIMVNSSTASVSIENSIIKNNEGSGTHAQLCHGAVSLNGVTTVTITGCEITENKVINSGSGSAYGGGLYLTNNDNSATVTISDTLITENSASNGGGICMSYAGTITITNSVVCENTATADDDSSDLYVLSAYQPTLYLLPASEMSYGSEVSTGDYNAWQINGDEQQTGSFPIGSTADTPLKVEQKNWSLKAVSVNTGNVVSNTTTTTDYKQISEAVDAAKENNTLKMLDIDGRSNESVIFNKDLTLDLNGQILKGKTNSTPDAVLEVAAGKTLTLTNTSESVAVVGASNNTYSVYLDENATLKLPNNIELTTPVYLSEGSAINLTDAASEYNSAISITLSDALAKMVNEDNKDVTLITVNDADAEGLNSLISLISITNDLSLYCSLKVSEDGKSIVLSKNADGIYLDGENGSDDNDGSYSTPVKTFAKAKELLEEKGYNTIYVIGTVTVSSDETWSLGDGQSLERYETFKNGVLAEVTEGTLTLENITIDGRNIETTYSLIRVNGGNLIINDGTVIQNSNNTVSGEVSEQEAAVTVLNGTLTMNGGTISNNTGNWGGGIAVIAKENNKATMTLNGGYIIKNTAKAGGGIFLYGNATLTMNGGNIAENTATEHGGGMAVWSGAVATINAGNISSNTQTYNNSWGGGGIYVDGVGDGNYGNGKLELYNVEITGNMSKTSLTDGYNSYRATISICETGILNINMKEGSVIHDNETPRELVLDTIKGKGTFKISPFMLSGGAYNWTLNDKPVDVENLVVDRNSLLQFKTNIENTTGEDRIKTKINDNTASGFGAAIGVNGELTIGHDDGEVTLEIKKVWGEDVEQQESVEVEVFAVNSQGTKTHITGDDTVTLNEADDWTKTIEHLPKYDSFYDQDTQTSGTYTYMVVEKESDSENETASYSAFVSCVEVDDKDDNDDTVKYEITVANLQKAELSIKKIVEGITTDQSFDFEIGLAYKGGPYNGTASASDATDVGVQKEYALAFTNGKANVTLKADETLTLTLGAGMTYTVTETDSKGASKVMVNESEATSASGTITADGASIVVTNIYTGDEPTPEPTEETGDLTVSKTVEGTGADTTKAFTFTVTLDDASISGTYGDMTFANGVATFTLIHGQSKTADNLPENVGYEVTEEAADHYTSSSENETGTIESNVIKNVVFTNTYTSDGGEEPETGTGTLTVSKTVTGSGSKTREFTFTVTLSDTSINGTYGDMTFVNGVATFTLKHGESVTAEGLPEGVTYTVTEASISGYRATSDGATGTIENGGIATVAFTNSKTSSGGGSSSGGSGGGSSSSSSTSGTTAGSTSGPGVASSDSGTSDSGNPGDPGDPASSSDADPLTALPKTGDNGTNTAMFTLLFGMVAVAYVILSDRRKEKEN